MIGNYTDSGGVKHGFIYSNGTFTNLPVVLQIPAANGINDAGRNR